MRQAVKKHLFPNGLTLIVDEAPELRSVSIGAWVKTGSRHEDPKSWGMCHFLEHMIFKGGEQNGAMELSKAVDRVGGDFNAFTSREHTCFHFYLPAKELELGTQLLQEILYRPLFAKKEIERERQVILQEIAMTQESPEEDSFDRFLEKVFGPHAIGRNILGSPKSVQSLDRASVLQFFHRHYRPENMVIAVSGAVQFSTVLKQLKPLGESTWPGREHLKSGLPNWGSEPPSRTEPGFWWFDDASEQSHLVYGIAAPLKSQKERMISTVLQQHLGGGMSSVLFDQIRERKGWAYNVYASSLQFLDTSLFTLYAGVKEDRVLSSLKVFDSELRRIARSGIPLADLQRIQDSLIYSLELSLESSESRMMSISSAELFFNREMSFQEYEEIVRSVTVADSRELMQVWLKTSRPTIFVLGKKPRGLAWAELKDFARAKCGEPIQVSI